MGWYKISLSSSQVLAGEGIKIRDQFVQMYNLLNVPIDTALFVDSKPHEGMNFYFSPESIKFAKDIIDNYSGSPCDQPRADEVTLLIGYTKDIDHLL
jgi:hypothetical protein